MNIQEAQPILKQQVESKRTIGKNRIITEMATQNIVACIGDINNQQVEATLCETCGLLVSVLLIAEGCPNCNGLDFNSNIALSQFNHT